MRAATGQSGATVGDRSGEVVATWQGKELLCAVHRAVGTAAARAALNRFCRRVDEVGGEAVAPGPHGQAVGGRDPGLSHYRRLLQRLD